MPTARTTRSGRPRAGSRSPTRPGIKAEARRLTRVRRIRYYPVRIRDGMIEVAVPQRLSGGRAESAAAPAERGVRAAAAGLADDLDDLLRVVGDLDEVEVLGRDHALAERAWP